MLQEKETNINSNTLSEEEYKDISELDQDWVENEDSLSENIELHYGLYLIESLEEASITDCQTYTTWPIEEDYLEYKEVKKAFDYCTASLTFDQIAKLAKGFNKSYDKHKHYMVAIFSDEHKDKCPAALLDTFDLVFN